MNGEFVPESDAKISIYDSALMFGDMVFEMTRSFDGVQFKLKEHIERLYAGLKIYRIPIELSPSQLEAACYETIEMNKHLFKENDEHRLMIDVSRGLSNDYSAFCVIDVTQTPYKLVAKYRNNDIKPIVFPSIINKVATHYNKAFVLIEINDLGQQVADAMQFELEYDNMMMVTQRGRSGQVLGGGFSGRGNQLGLRMTKGTKKIGTSNMKSLIEGNKLIINDFDIIAELSTFIARGKSFEAEQGATDDLVMCLVIFSWLANQRYFKELTNVDVRGQMFTDQQNAIEADMAPFGFIDNGLDDPEGMNNSFFDDSGELWQPVRVIKGE